MHKHTLLNRTATLAIAATVAFSSTPLLAQDAPAAEAPAETVTTAEPVAAEPVSTDPHAGHVAETAPVARAPAPKPRAKAKAKASPPVARAAPAQAETVAAVPEPSPLAAPTIVSPLSQPVAEPTAATIEPAMAAPNDDLERAAFAGIVALLALGGAATALSRRRRAHRVADGPAMHDVAHTSPSQPMPANREPVPQASSAFAWGRNVPAASPGVNAGGLWVERARRGPTPDNPSLSLKKRMKRAAFYEQRERAVAAGRAKPLVPEAGLPERATENFQGGTPQPAYTHALQPA